MAAIETRLAGRPVDPAWSGDEATRLRRLMALLAHLPSPPDPHGAYPRYGELREGLRREIADGNDAERLEEAFLELYAHLHGHEAPYTTAERRRMDELGGYWCHAGGLSPILRAGDHLAPASVSADYGAGNGLQCLLMMALFPHARTRQIELSSRMIDHGRALRDWLGIDADRVEWIAGDILDHPPAGLDFIYLYRPVRPEGEGRRFYEMFAATLARAERQVVIFSIADCLDAFLGPEFEVFDGDGHLTCYRKNPAM